MPEDIDLNSALGGDDFEYLQYYIEEHSRYMNERKFGDRYREKSMSERFRSECRADIFDILEREDMYAEEGYNNFK